MSRMRTFVVALMVAGACGAGLSACGLITAGVSVPEAFAQNNDLGLKGTITDDQGKPLDDVAVTVKREYYLWHADRSYPEFDTKTVMANHQFEIPERRAHELTFTFRKPGYKEQTVVEAQKHIKGGGPWMNGDQWPLGSAVAIVMMPEERKPAALRWLMVRVEYTDPAKQPVVDLSKALAATENPTYGNARESAVARSQDAVTVLATDQKVPAHGLYAVIERQPTKTTGPERRVDPLDINMPARMTFRINDADAGFVPIVPKGGTYPLGQMNEAPEAGYEPELVLPESRLRQLRDQASSVISERNELFFFRANGQYGKGVISWVPSGGESFDTHPLWMFVVVMMQPDGSRNLTTHSR